jgi:Zn-dependent protease
MHRPVHRKAGIHFSSREKYDLAKAWVMLSLAFTILFSRSIDLPFTTVFIVILLTAGLGFLMHEMAHKVSAIRFGHEAEFVADTSMLFFAIIMALFLPIVFAAPGAVYIRGAITKAQNGIISVVGPWTNIVIAFLFLPLALFGPGILSFIGSFGFSINSWLALFNMLPFGPLDGAKVFAWNKAVFAGTMGLAALMSISAFL